MTIEMKKESKSLTLKIAGRLDTMSAPEMEKAVNSTGTQIYHFINSLTVFLFCHL